MAAGRKRWKGSKKGETFSRAVTAAVMIVVSLLVKETEGKDLKWLGPLSPLWKPHTIERVGFF